MDRMHTSPELLLLDRELELDTDPTEGFRQPSVTRDLLRRYATYPAVPSSPSPPDPYTDREPERRLMGDRVATANRSLSLEDMDPSFASYLGYGLFNADFKYASPNTDTAHYWTIDDDTNLAVTVVDDPASPGGHVVRCTPSGVSPVGALITSARVPVADTFQQSCLVAVHAPSGAVGPGDISIEVYATWWDENGNSTSVGPMVPPWDVDLADTEYAIRTFFLGGTFGAFNSAFVDVTVHVTSNGSGNPVDIQSVSINPLRPTDMVVDPADVDLPWVNVKSPLFGAVGDGVTDDTAAIQAAIDYATLLNTFADPDTDESVHGAMVLFPPGLFRVSTLNWASNVAGYGIPYSHNRGANDTGAYVSRIKQLDGVDAPLIFVPKEVIGYAFYNLFLDGNKANQTDASVHHGIEIEFVAAGSWSANAHSTRALFQDLRIQNFLGYGVKTSPAHLAPNFVRGQYSSCDVGLYINCTDSTIDGLTLSNNDTYGLWVSQGFMSAQNLVTFDNGVDIEVSQDGSTGYTNVPKHLSFTGCYIEKADTDGLHIGADVESTTWSACRFRNNSESGADAGSHVVIDSDLSSHTFTGCIFEDSDGNVTYDFELNGDAVILVAANVHNGDYTTERYSSYSKVSRCAETHFKPLNPGGGFAATTNVRIPMHDPGGIDKFCERVTLAFLVGAGTALDSANKWVVAVVKELIGGAAGGGGTIATFTIDSGSSAVWRNTTPVTVNALLGSSCASLLVTITKTGTPGTLQPALVVEMRDVGP